MPFVFEEDEESIGLQQNLDDDFKVKDYASIQAEATQQDLTEIVNSPQSREPEGLWSKLVDYLSRGQYFGTKVADTFFTSNKEFVATLGDAISKGAQEAWNPQERLSYKDIIKRHISPDFAAKHPVWTEVIGGALDIAVDPTTYLTFGASGEKSLLVNGKRVILNKNGTGKFKEMYRAALELGQEQGERLIDNLTDVERAMYKFSALSENTKVPAGMLRLYATKTAEQKMIDIIGKAVDPKEFIKTPNRITKLIDDTFGIKEQLDRIKQLEVVTKVSNVIGKPALFAKKLFDREGYFKALYGETGTIYNQFTKNMQTYVEQINDMVSNKIVRIFKDSDYESVNKTFNTISKIQKAKGAFDEKMVQLDEIQNLMMQNAQVLEDSYKQFGGILPDEEIINMVPHKELPPMPVFEAWEQSHKEVIKHVLRTELGANHTKEFEAIAGLNGLHGRVIQVEKELDLYDELAGKWDNKLFDQVANSRRYLQYKKTSKIKEYSAKALDKALPPNVKKYLAKEIQWFRDMDTLANAGHAPDQDALITYTANLISLEKSKAHRAWKEGLTDMFSDNTRDLAGGRISKFSDALNLMKSMYPEIYKDLRFVGNPEFSMFNSDTARKALKVMDKITGLFKRSATIGRFAFAPRQALFQNPLQAIMTQGWKSIKTFDPRNLGEAAYYIWEGKPGYEGIVDTLKMTTDLGDVISGREIHNVFKELAIMRSQDVMIEHRITRNIAQEIAQRQGRTATSFALKKVLGEDRFRKVNSWFNLPAKFMQVPAMVEDFARVSIALQAIRQGHSYEDAARLANKAFFDYTFTHTPFEKQIMKRFFPFYTFQKNAYALIYDTLKHHPGRVAGVDKAMHTFSNAIGKFMDGEELNMDERLAAPGFLIEQPVGYAGLGEDGQHKFVNLSGLSLLDIMNFVENDDKGEIDVKGTFRTMFAAQLTPIVKVPIEAYNNWNYFTNKPIAPNYGTGKRKIGQVDLEDMVGKMAEQVVFQGTGGNMAVAQLGQWAGESMSNVESVKRAIKWGMGWEEMWDPYGKKQTVYVSPYRMHLVASFFPWMHGIVRQSEEGKTPLEEGLETTLGIATRGYSLKQGEIYERKKMTEKKRRLRQDLRELRARFKGAGSAREEEIQRDIAELQEQIMKQYAEINVGNIRGN